MMTITNLQKTVLMHMTTDGKGVTSSQLRRMIYSIEPSRGRLPSDRLTRAMMALAHAGYLKRPPKRHAGGYGYILTPQGAEWVGAERERIARADENEGSNGVSGIQKYDEVAA